MTSKGIWANLTIRKGPYECMDNEPDVVVVGASIAGCIAARHAASKGARVTILEEHGQVGKQRKCTSIVSATGLPGIGVEYKPAILHSVRGAFIHSPNRTMEVRAGKTKAYVLDRQAFDEQCAREAEKAGAHIALDEPAIGYSGHTVQTPKRTLRAQVLIGADGAASALARSNGFPTIPASRYALCYEAEYEAAHITDPSMVEVFLDNNFYPGFFAWAVPTGPEGVRVGLGTTDHPRLADGRAKLFSNSIIRDVIQGARKTREFHALIPLSVRGKTQSGTTLLVGDAAGQVKATTGGGWVYGGNCARIAGEATAGYLAQEAPLDYERAWRARMHGPLSNHLRIRNLLDSLSNQKLDLLVGSMAALRFNKVLELFGDMDYILKV